MINKNLNVIVFGANYYGRNASSNRLRNLFEPLANLPNITLHNLVLEDKEFSLVIPTDKVTYHNLKYNIKNPVSILLLVINSAVYLLKNKKKLNKNIFYCYGFPSIENIFILIFCKVFRYKIVFDIAENENLNIDVNKSSRRMQFKHYTMLKLQKLLPILGSKCFAISYKLVDFCNQLCKRKIPIVLLPISVNIEKIHLHKNTNKKKEKIQVFYGGSFGSKDGIDYLLDGFEQVCKQLENIELLLTGKANYRDEKHFLQKIENSRIKEKIKYLGCLSYEDYLSIMANADILCMVRVNNQYANTGFPFKLGEYLASGNAVIATNVCEITSIITHKKNAFLIEPESSVQIANAIIFLCNDEDLRNKMGLDALKIANEFFDANKISKILLSNLIG
jgi:glycosyltransferase involved in cell wall biosynthesis